jgi:hypothetical protein
MKRATIGVTAALAALLVCAGGRSARSDVITPGNVLVSVENFGGPLADSVLEYTASGTLLQQFNVPYPGGRPATEDVRGIATNSAGQVQIYNGTFSPFLTTLTPTAGGPGAGTYAHTTLAGMSVIANVSFGEIGVLGNLVFAPDMATAGAGSPNGIVRFDLSGATATRFATGTDYSTVTVGGDGLVYAINQQFLPAATIDVYNPTTMALVRTITLSSTAMTADLRGIAVDASGTIYAAGWDGKIYQLSSTGAVLNSLTSGKSNLESIALDPTNRLVVGGRFGDVILTTIALTSETTFAAGSNPIHVAFVTPLAPIPEPSIPILCSLLVPALYIYARHRRSASASR